MKGVSRTLLFFFVQKQTLVLIYEELYIRKTVLEWENWFPEEHYKRSHNTSQLNAFFLVVVNEGASLKKNTF